MGTPELTILNVEQRSDAWYEARCGIVTASAVGKLVTPRTIKPASNDDSRGLANLLASERVTGHVEDTYTSSDMWRGIEAERRDRVEPRRLAEPVAAEARLAAVERAGRRRLSTLRLAAPVAAEAGGAAVLGAGVAATAAAAADRARSRRSRAWRTCIDSRRSRQRVRSHL